MLPMELKFELTDLLLFHQIYNGQSVLKLPPYLTPKTSSEQGRLRSNIRQPSRYNEVDTSQMPDINQRRQNRHDHFSLKCTVEAKAHSFKRSFFFRTHSVWNDLPTDLKEISDAGTFKANLTKHFWDKLTDPD